MPFVYILTLYWLPGWVMSGIFRGQRSHKFFFQIFLSFLVTPVIYTFLGLTGTVTWVKFGASLLGLFIFLKLIRKMGRLPPINLDDRLADFRPHKGLVLIAAVFLLINIIPRLGLPAGLYPVGDDMRQMGKTVSIAESPRLPIFYHFPTTRMTIYYFGNVGAGLLVKFSMNQIPTHVAWLIHVSLLTLAIVYLFLLASVVLFESRIGKTVCLLSLTFFSGYEIYVAGLKGVNPIRAPGWTDLEWWTDWFSQIFNIHFQISSFYTLSFWVPQHLFAGAVAVFLYLIWQSARSSKSPTKNVLLGFLFAVILGYSAFVFLTVAAAFALAEFTRLWRREKKLKDFIADNSTVAIIFALIAWDLIVLYLGAEKGSWFKLQLNVFWFLQNNTLVNKIINLALTAPTLLIIELGGLCLAFPYLLLRLLRGEKDSSLFFWHFSIFLPLAVMFFLRAEDDNNISLRATIPALIGLSIFAGKLAEEIRPKRFFSGIFLFLLTAGLPTTAYNFSQRFHEIFSYGRERLDPIYAIIDKETPLLSIVFSRVGEWTEISALGHRFTFKPIKNFIMTDREYSALSKTKEYLAFESVDLNEIQSFRRKVIEENPQLSAYQFYLLDKENNPGLRLVGQSQKYRLYAL